MIKTAIVGITGYAGEVLMGILLKHPGVSITHVSAKIDAPQDVSTIFPYLRGRTDLRCELPDIEKIKKDAELVFLALPHKVSMEYAGTLADAGRKVIDLSADYRFKDTALYETHYATKHKDPHHIAGAVYGLPELYKDAIRKSAFIANPGCYPTAAILAVAPLLKGGMISENPVIIDAKSGVTGAGRSLRLDLLFSELNENFKPYKVDAHQHAPEIQEQYAKIAKKDVGVIFVPHLFPARQGIEETIYITLKQGMSEDKVYALYKDFYAHAPFVRVYEKAAFPQTRNVLNTNFCDIGIKASKNNTMILCACIDNLYKGAASQAVQNMNIMYGLPETEGLL
jgi:N-acetyl-gamma-glutamyl-phosphate reductase